MIKKKLQSYSALEKEKKISFGNDAPAFIKGKGSVHLKEKVKVGNVMYVDGLKHNLLSVSQMCDQGTEVIFRSNGCIVCELDTGKTVIRGIRTPNNLYVLKGEQQQCYLSKNMNTSYGTEDWDILASLRYGKHVNIRQFVIFLTSEL